MGSSKVVLSIDSRLSPIPLRLEVAKLFDRLTILLLSLAYLAALPLTISLKTLLRK